MLALKSSSSLWLVPPTPSGYGLHKRSTCFAVCAAKGPRPRSPRVWKTNKRIGTISKAAKFVDCVKGLSNVKEEVYGALDSFVAWELEFPLITVKKALKTFEYEGDWKRIIQVSKWMLSKGQGKTRGTYLTLLSALAEEGRLEEAEELWNNMFRRYMEALPRNFFQKMISIYYRRGMHDKMIELFADMEELEIKPNIPIVNMIGDVLLKLDMPDKYEKLKNKYPPPKWTIRYIKGKRVRLPAKYSRENNRRLTSTSGDGHVEEEASGDGHAEEEASGDGHAEEEACLSSDEGSLDEPMIHGNVDAEDVEEEGSSSSDEDASDELFKVRDEARSFHGK